MTAVRTLSVAEDEADLRLDRWFRRHFPELAHGRLEKLLRTGQIRVDGRRAKAGLRLAPGQAIRIPPAVEAGPSRPAVAAPAVSRQNRAALEAAVLHRDDWVIALDKPPGLAVQGGTGQTRHLDAMLEALRFDAAEPPRLVHRLDKDTSGVLILGRSREATRRLAEAFRSRAARKLYWAAVAGIPERSEGRIDLALAKGGGAGRERMREDATEGRRAVTRYEVIDILGKTAAWLALMPLTGRTHQLRAHCAALGTPILGDGKYGGRKAFAAGGAVPKRLHLHARAISLPHPSGRGLLEVTASLPPHMVETWAFLGFDETAGGGFD